MSNLPAWLPLTLGELKSVMTPKEVNDFGKIGTDGTPDDRAVVTLVNLVAEIRDFIGTWSTNTLSADPSLIPPGMVARALVIARQRVLTSVPGYAPGDTRQKEYDAAEKFFQSVASGKVRPQPSPDAVPNQAPSEQPSGVSFTVPPKRTGRAKMNGL